MFSLPQLAGLSLLLSFVRAQSSSSAYVEPTVPTGTPIPGDYTGALRPQIHYSPPQHFMVDLAPYNDPNGMFLDGDGVYHLYYQCENGESRE
ncbi:MAG: hypothetical protein Q9228_000559 [Teloschistes exilis]